MRLKICKRCDQAKPSTEFGGLAHRICMDCKKKSKEAYLNRKNVSLTPEEYDLVLQFRRANRAK